MKRIYPAFAAMLCTLPLLHTAASAEDAALTFELTVDDGYVFASEVSFYLRLFYACEERNEDEVH